MAARKGAETTVAIEEAYVHCVQAVLRSGLWQPPALAGPAAEITGDGPLGRPGVAEFLATAPFLALSTWDSHGRSDTSPRGDRQAAARILDSRTLVLAVRGPSGSFHAGPQPPDEIVMVAVRLPWRHAHHDARRAAMITYTATVVTEERAEHAEGPTWDARRDELLWVDQFAGLVHRSRYAGGVLRPVHTYKIGVAVGAVVPVAGQDGWMLAAGAGFIRLAADGRTEVLAEPEAAVRATNRMNDGKCDPRGRFYAGSMAWSKQAGAGSLYRYDGTVRTMLREVTISNGMAWSAAGDRMYYIDTPTGQVDVFTVGADGEPADRRPAFPIDPADGAPDGMCIDDEDCLWVALWGGSKVCRYAPTGEKLATVRVPAPQVSSCAFGRRTLFITTSQEGYGPADSDRHPGAGRLYAVDLPVGGPAATPMQAGPGLP